MKIAPNIDLKASETRMTLAALSLAGLLGLVIGVCALFVMAP
jgi:hypothetical protein